MQSSRKRYRTGASPPRRFGRLNKPALQLK